MLNEIPKGLAEVLHDTLADGGSFKVVMDDDCGYHFLVTHKGLEDWVILIFWDGFSEEDGGSWNQTNIQGDVLWALNSEVNRALDHQL